MTKSIVLAACLWPTVAFAAPIIVKPANVAIVWTGNAGVVDVADVAGPLVWTSTEHLRIACFEQFGANGLPTTDDARSTTCVRQTFVDGLYVYTMAVDWIPPCFRAQGDSELDAGSIFGLWLVVNRSCVVPPIEPPTQQPAPVPEPATLKLLALGLALAWRFTRRK